MVAILLGIAAGLTMGMLALAPKIEFDFLPRQYLVTALVTLAIGLPTWLGWRYVVPPLVHAYPGPLTLALAGGAVIVVGVLLGTAITASLMTVLGYTTGPFFLPLVLRIGFVVAIAVSAVLVFVHRVLGEAHARRLEAEEARRREVEARLEALRSRTNPHFLFNALNTIAGLVHDDPDAAERAVEELSALLRYTLEASRAERLPLGEELAVVRRYLALEGVRLGERLRSELAVEEGLDTLAVPPLVLLPLVENAVRHGIAPRREGGLVRVEARRDGDTLVLAVEDDGPGPGASTARGTGTSLADLRARLALLGGSLETGPGEGGGFRAVVRLPLRPAPREDR